MKLLIVFILTVFPYVLNAKESNTTELNNSMTKSMPAQNSINKEHLEKTSYIDYFKSKWIEIVGLLIAFLTFFLPLYKYITQKREELRDKRFQTYHNLIQKLVQPDDDGVLMLDRQIATAYEFRNYPEYYELTERIFTDLKEQWSSDDNNTRIVKELDLTINYINNTWYKNIFRCMVSSKT